LGQLAVVKQGAVHTYLSQLQLIPGPVKRVQLGTSEAGPGISGLNALGWPKPSVLYRNEEGPLIHLLIRAAADCFEERASISQFRMILISKKEL
jgi:hypothetical protein